MKKLSLKDIVIGLLLLYVLYSVFFPKNTVVDYDESLIEQQESLREEYKAKMDSLETESLKLSNKRDSINNELKKLKERDSERKQKDEKDYSDLAHRNNDGEHLYLFDSLTGRFD